MTEISTAYGPDRRWKKVFESSGVESIKNAKVEQNLHLIKKSFQKIMESIEGDARLTARDIKRKVGISLSDNQRFTLF